MEKGTSLFEFKGLDDEQQKRVAFIKDKAADLFRAIEDHAKSSREKSLAVTKLEEAVMWISKSISREVK